MTNNSRTRDASAITNRMLRSDMWLKFNAPMRLREYEDRRSFHPEGDYAPAKSFSQSRHRLTVKKLRQHRAAPSLKTYSPSFVAFEQPNKVLICVRRKIRKEVLHAFRKAGRSGQRRPRRSWFSAISC